MSRNRHLPSHANCTELKEMLNEENKQKAADLRTLLRSKFNHSFNQKTLENGHGELILERRPKSSFKVSDYGPCPGCLLWLSLNVMRKHKNSCPNRQMLPSGTSLITQSDVITRRISANASDLLVKEVYSIMKRDLVGNIAREDELITLLGNQWLQKNIGNRLMRGSYTSQIMRLCARLLLNLREIEPIDGDLWDYLKPKYFETIVKATLQVADFINDENLGKPSNARKLGFDIKRLINAKIGTSILNGDNESRTEASDLLRSVEIFWGTRVAKLSNVNLEERRYNKRKELPKPKDIEKLNLYLEQEISSLNLENTSFENFVKVGELIEAKLVSYNRRRTGELEAIRLTDFLNRNRETAPEHLVGELSKFEQKLLESQEVVTVRGKVGRGVPIIIPEIAKPGLSFLTNTSVREAANILESNPYVFASRGKGVVRAYDALSKASHNAALECPELVTSTSLRKYMATITQVLGLKPNEMEWVIDHLGHSMDIHKIHYRSTSDILSKTQIAKLLMVQDMGRVGAFKNMSLNDIQMEDVVYGNPREEELSSDIFDVAENLSDDGNNDIEPIIKKKKKKKTDNSKGKWSEEEENELKSLFSKYIQEKKRPTPRECLKAMVISKKKGGLIHYRKKDVLKKKMFRIIDKLKKLDK